MCHMDQNQFVKTDKWDFPNYFPCTDIQDTAEEKIKNQHC